MTRAKAIALPQPTLTWKMVLMLAGFTVGLLMLSRVAHAGEYSCGDDHVACGDEERCCEHTVATFCDKNGCASSYVHGECVAKTASCGDYWCGNKHCKTSWLMSNDVCCIYNKPGSAPAYSCESSEVSCPGNTAQLTIRPKLASSKLQGEE